MDDQFGTHRPSFGHPHIRILTSPPWANAICERMMGTLRRELLDRILVRQRTPSTPDPHELSAPFHYRAATRTLGQLAPAQAETQPPPVINLADYQVRRRAILNGLTSEYQIAA